MRSSERVMVSHGPQMWRISVLSVAQKVSMAALSNASPTLP
jgi:hypothetical protein